MIAWSLLQGVLAFATVALAYVVSLKTGSSVGEARALAFTWLVVSIASLILVNRSFSTSFLRAFSRPNMSLAWVAVTVAAILFTALLWPPASALFGFRTLRPIQWAATLIYFPIMVVLLEMSKFVVRDIRTP